MLRIRNKVQIQNEEFGYATEKGIINLKTSALPDKGRTLIMPNGKEVVSFTSCSTLGLEYDDRLKNGSKKATDDFGTIFSTSRSFIGLALLKEAEDLLAQVFGSPCIFTTNTTLGHQAVIPLILGHEDVAILDHQVHASVQLAVSVAKSGGTKVEMVRHNNMEMLESRIKKHQKEGTRVWYFADGVYSMFGDLPPYEDLKYLLEKYDNFYLYMDDAHGMTWMGENGRGVTLSHLEMNDKMIMATSLSKSFGAHGGVLILPNERIKQQIINCGSTLIFTIPSPPATLGAVIASAKIHLSNDITGLQDKLKRKLELADKTFKKYELPIISNSPTPIYFIGFGPIEVGYELSNALTEAGFLLSMAGYPSVPKQNCGMRVSININHTDEDIISMIAAVAEFLPQAWVGNNYSMEKVRKAFKLK